jgi:hypothetical protein
MEYFGTGKIDVLKSLATRQSELETIISVLHGYIGNTLASRPVGATNRDVSEEPPPTRGPASF